MKVTSPQEIKNKKRYKLHQLPSGIVVEISKIDPMELLKAANVVPDDFKFPQTEELQGLAAEEKNVILSGFEEIFNKGLQNLQKDGKTQIKATEFLITNGVNNPKVTFKPLEEVGDEEVHVSDFGDELDILVEAIIEFSGLSDGKALENLKG